MSTTIPGGSRPNLGSTDAEDTLSVLLTDLVAEAHTLTRLLTANELSKAALKESEELMPENQTKALLEDPDISPLKKKAIKVIFSGTKHLVESVEFVKKMARFGKKSKKEQQWVDELEASMKQLEGLLRQGETPESLITSFSEQTAQPKNLAKGQ